MLVSKMVQIEFASPNIKAVDSIHDIRKAAESAGLNLFAQYGVQLQMPMLSGDSEVVVEIKIPEAIVDTFSIGNHLRGIALYLLRNYGERYTLYVVGKRLLNYNVISGPEPIKGGLSTTERLEAVVSFARLLERTDDRSQACIAQILTILKEVDT